MGRHHRQIWKRYNTLDGKRSRSSEEFTIVKEKLFQLIDEHLGQSSFTELPFETFAAELGCSKHVVEKYWLTEGKRKYERSKLPRWTLSDSHLLLTKVEETGEEEELSVDFKAIFEGSFRGKCANWEHLRERFTRIRIATPLYMLDDLQSVVKVSKRHVEDRMMRGDIPCDSEEEPGGDDEL